MGGRFLLFAAAITVVPLAAATHVWTDSGTYEISGGEIGALRDCKTLPPLPPVNDCLDLGGVIWDGCASSRHGDGIRDIDCESPDGHDLVVASLTDAHGQPAAGYLCYSLDPPRDPPFGTNPPHAARCDRGVSFCGSSPGILTKVENHHVLIVYADWLHRVPPEVCAPATSGTATLTIQYDFCFGCIPSPENQATEDEDLHGYLVLS